MRKPNNIFIASSDSAKALAVALKQHLNDFCEITLWFDEKEKTTGTTITERLQKRAKKSDFAVVILTEDDFLYRNGDQKRTGLWVPRDNCVFEAGFFTGALGVDFRRCFLVCDVSCKDALPTDLQEREHIDFKKPANLEDAHACHEAMKDVAKRIRSEVTQKGLFADRPIVPLVTKDILMELEQTGTGGNLTPGSVVVNSTQPLEKDYPFAVRVMENMRANIEYLYFFHGNKMGGGTGSIVEMVQVLSLADLIAPDDIPTTLSGWVEIRLREMKKKLTDVVKRLDIISTQLRIYFLQNEVPIEFCVHNAWSHQDAKCYLRYSKEAFIEWHKREPRRAMAVAEELLDQRHHIREDGIFRSTKKFDLYAAENQRLRESLSSQIRRHFVEELHEKVMETCFGKGFSSEDAEFKASASSQK